ncbi:MAG: outer membrane beta-barrel protein [Williamsia sp.]|nr:outer membrane beta-barrel protein [Williamsia sp.]
MHDHDFEKQVHQKMEELQLSPSYTVWERVEEKLHKKKRRRIVFWVPFLLAGLLIGGYYWMQDGINTKQAETFSTNPVSSPAHSAEKAPVTTETNVGTPNPKPSLVATSLQPAARIPARIKEQKQVASAATLPHAAPLSPELGETNKAGKNKGDRAQENQPAIVAVKTPVEEKKSEEKKSAATSGTAEEETGKVVTGAVILKDPSAATVSTILPLREPAQGISASVPAGELAARTIRLTTKSRFHWGINLELMKTSVNKGSLGKLFSQSLAAADQFSTPGTIPGNVGSTVPGPSAIQAATGFSAGFFLNRELTSRLTLSTGLNYALFANSVMIGSSRSSSSQFFNSTGIERYYLAGTSITGSKYTNKYHFIELPVLLQVQLNRGKLPVIWEGGLSLSRLLASNALHYNSSVGGYYKDNSLITHTQVGVLTGLQIKAFANARFPVLVGPQIQIGLSNLSAGTTSERNHLAQYGLQISTVIK